MNLSPVVIAIPIFFSLMIIELIFEAITSKKTYRLNDAITNINLGTMEQVSGVFFKLLKIGVYTAVYQYFSIYQIQSNWFSFVILFILYDLCYYWSHRMAHQVNLFWGGHVVHHQSEDYNLSVALRQSSTQFLWSIPFYLPLALMGFDPIQFVIVGGFNLLYQFWIHTEHIDRMPSWFEAVMNTPSHHRVHHARNPKYIDTNFAGVFIIWDRMFKTFKPEEDRPIYGITVPINSWNPVYVNFVHYINIFKMLFRVKNTHDAFKLLFSKPGWRPEYLGGYIKPKEVAVTYQKYDAEPQLMDIKWYALIQFLFIMGVNAFFLFRYQEFTTATTIIYALWILGSTIIFGFYFEYIGKQLVLIEFVRLATLLGGAWFLFPFNTPTYVLIGLIVISSIIAFTMLQLKTQK